MQPCVGETCPPKPEMQKAPDQSDQVVPQRKKRVQSTQQNNVDVDTGSNRRTQHADWRYDPNRHKRSRSKSTTYRFYFGGWWYPQPYWDSYAFAPYRISCGEGRAIVASRYTRVRVVECSGGVYTYLGRRYGDTWRVLVNSRSGRIVGRTEI